MVMLPDLKILYTVDEFEAFADAPENSDRLLELIHGEIEEKMPTDEHGALALKAGSRILVFEESNQLGGRTTVEARHRVPADKHNARLPDVAYTTKARLLPLTKKGSVPQMPDLAVEIKSPADKPAQLREKAQYYLHNGTRIVWLVYPEIRTVEVCTLQNNVVQILPVDENGILSGGDVLPGFALALKDLFDIT